MWPIAALFALVFAVIGALTALVSVAHLEVSRYNVHIIKKVTLIEDFTNDKDVEDDTTNYGYTPPTPTRHDTKTSTKTKRRPKWGHKPGTKPDWRGILSATLAGALTTFVAATLINWMFFYWGTLVLNGADLWWLLFIDSLIAGISFGVWGYFKLNSINLTAVLSTLMVLFVIFGSIWQSVIWIGSGNAATLKSEVSVTMMPTIDQDPLNGYPNTDDNHMPVVRDQTARYAAHFAMNTNGLGTRYQLGAGTLQAVQGHLYYLFELLPNGWSNTRAAEYTVPCYVVVDAEDPSQNGKAKCDYTENGVSHKIAMHWWPGGWYGSNLERHVWMNGYPDYYVDNLTLEVDDNWKPYYTASINRAPVRWTDSVPVGFITVDVQSGAITRYNLDQIPSWVDRVYSATTVTTMLNWWGMWDQAQYAYAFGGTANRYKVDGTPTVVYTTDGVAWQALMTSLNDNDKSVRYIALFDTRSNKVRMYTAPSGLVTQDTVKGAFSSSTANLKKLDPTDLTLYKIDGLLVWGASLVSPGLDNQTENGYPKADSYHGFGFLNATNADANNVIVGNTKGDALLALENQIARGANNGAPSSNGKSDLKITGTVANVGQLQSSGSTYVVVTLNGDADHKYLVQIDPGSSDSLALLFLHQGDQVDITYTDLGKSIRPTTAIVLTPSTK